MDIMIIAEIGSNWEGDIIKAKKIILECKNAGVDAVKFQMWRAEDLYDDSIPEWNDIKKSELTFDIVKQLKNYSDDIGIEFFCSVFYPEAVDFLESLNVKRYKIASRTSAFRDSDSLSTLERISKTKKPVIASLGFGGDLEKLTNIFSHNPTTFCYCIPDYPTEFTKIDWKQALTFDGFSDHTLGIIAPLIFAAIKKSNNAKYIVIEKHVKLSSSVGPDADTSITTGELSNLIQYVRSINNSNF